MQHQIRPQVNRSLDDYEALGLRAGAELALVRKALLTDRKHPPPPQARTRKAKVVLCSQPLPHAAGSGALRSR